MGLFDRVEHKLERVVNGVFARAFKAEVQPVEIASAMRGAMDDRAAVVSHGRTVVPNAFTIELAPTDYERLHEYEDVLHTELVASVQEHAESQGYTPGGPVFVEFVEGDDLDTGVFRVLPTATRSPRPTAPGRPRPRNELVMPQATAQADGNVGLAGSAAQAAAAATAGTAAAARYGGLDPRDEPLSDIPPGYTDGRRAPVDEDDRRAREQQRDRDLAAWPEDEDENPRRGHDEAADDPWLAQRDSDPAPPTARAGVIPTPPPDPRPVTRRPWLELGLDSYPLLSAITVIGRDSTADITLPDSGISRRHCEIRVTHDGPHLVMSIRDLGSTNGTFVNGERITTARLVEGDRITVGRSSLSVRLGER